MILATSLENGSWTLNYEIACNPISAADVPGYTFRRDQNGAVIARCTVCRVGFTVRETNGEAVRYAMAMHRDFSHGCGGA